MTKDQLKEYRTNKRIYDKLDEEIDSLKERLAGLKIVSGQVEKSDKEWPYIRGHMRVEVYDPKPASAIQQKISEREQRRREIGVKLGKVERFIRSLPAEDAQIFEWIYIDGLTQEEVGEVIGYTQARVSQIIDKAVGEV